LHNHNQGIERERDGLLKNSVIFHQAFRRGRRFNSMTKQQLSSQKGVVDGLDVVSLLHRRRHRVNLLDRLKKSMES
jgi:hypothetical protein